MSSTQAIKSFITFGKPDIGEEEMSAVMDVMRSGWIGTGKVAKDLETEFVKYMGGGYAIAVSSGSIGLVIALRSVGVCHGDNVLTTPLTFCATVNSILQVGATPVFMDTDDRGCINIQEGLKLKGRINACLPVNYTGLQSNIDGWDKDSVPIVEDAAHSFGGTYLGKPQGWFSHIAVFSLYATKNITSGEGGIIWTKSKFLADKCRILSQQGQSSGAWNRYSSGPIDNYQVLHPGYKGNLPDILAAIGLVQLKRWTEMRKKREKVWNIYESAFGKKQVGHSRHLYTIRVKNREKLREDLYNLGIGTGIHYEALHLQPAYKYLGYKKGDFPNAEKIGEETLSLPVSNSMSEEDAKRVVKAIYDCDKI